MTSWKPGPSNAIEPVYTTLNITLSEFLNSLKSYGFSHEFCIELSSHQYQRKENDGSSDYAIHQWLNEKAASNLICDNVII